MAEPGIIHGGLEMKFLILYVLRHLDKPVALNNLAAMVICDDTIDYFQFIGALSELVESEHVIRGGGVYSASEKGMQAADICESGLPYAARMSAQKATLETLAKMSREASIKTEVIERNGDIALSCKLFDRETCMLSLELLVVSREQASSIGENFSKNAERIYNKVLVALTDDESLQ